MGVLIYWKFFADFLFLNSSIYFSRFSEIFPHFGTIHIQKHRLFNLNSIESMDYTLACDSLYKH